MPIQPGTTFGPYHVESFIGAGGMGEVYRARDSRLNRSVALKVLPAERVADPERRQRFIQEAQLASSLQHPNIVTIYDVGSGSDGSEYLAMELVQGQTLDTVIPAKGLRLADALRYGVQIADALAAAHTAGVLHRDLKPGNIMVTNQGQIKILDFGLATLIDVGPTHGEPGETRVSPTLVQTGAGTILGTVAYMSPEQAEGKTVDGRSDIFSLGAILYEMLSGQRAFGGDSAAATIAAVMNKEPQPLSQMASGAIPQPVERLVSRCLRKDLSRRAQHASDVKVALEELQEDSSTSAATQPTSARRQSSRSVVVIGGLAAAGLLAAAAVIWWPRSEPLPAAFLSTPLTSLTGSETNPSFSPDGTQVAFQWTPDGASGPDVYVQLVAGTGARLRLSNDGHSHEMPAWSPDGQWIAMWQQSSGTSGHQLTLISPLGGPERTLLAWDDLSGPIAWSPDNRWLATSPVNPRGTVNKGLVLLSPETGERVDWITVDPLFIGSAEPSFSPDGTRLAYTRTTGDFTGQLNVVAFGRDGRPAGAPLTVAYKGQELHFPVWTADGNSLLLVEGSSSSNGGVTRIPLDAPERAQRLGGLEHVKQLALSDDGTKLVFSRGGDDSEIWRFDLRDLAKSGRLASSTLWDGDAQYSPNGQRIAFASNRNGGRELWVSDADGGNAQPVTHFDGPVPGTPRWSPDGRQIVFDGRPGGNSDIFVVSAEGGPIQQLTTTPGEDARPAWAADGQSIYFSSNRSGRPEIWRMDVAGGNPVQVTRNGALAVLASPERPYLFYKRFGSGTPVYRIREDGTEDEAFSEPSFAFLPFAVTASGLWFIGDATTPLADWAVFLKRFADRKTAEVATFDWEPNGLAISVSPDERYVLVTKQDTNGTDLRLVNGFR